MQTSYPSRFRKCKAFALAEVMIALVVVTLAILLVGSLSEQVGRLRNSSKQTSSVVELRSRTNSMTKNLTNWLNEMRSAPAAQGNSAGCIPDSSTGTTTFTCPAVDDTLLQNDANLKQIAGSQLHASSVPIVDLLGDQVAGTISNPLYLDSEGRACTQNNPSSTCPMKSTGFLLRSNTSTSADPGAIRFVIKVENNQNISAAKGSYSPMKAQYLSIDVGNDWTDPTGICPADTIKLGYLASGTPNCVNPSIQCKAGDVNLGVDPSGNPICKTPPTCETGSVVLNVSTNQLICSTKSPCAINELFLGYFAGTGNPICSSADVTCPGGQVQTGMTEGGDGKLTAQCTKVPTCTSSEKLSFNGTSFSCLTSATSSCPTGQVVVGLNADGTPSCQAPDRSLASDNLTCPAGQFMYGINKDGSVKCQLQVAPSGQILCSSLGADWTWNTVTSSCVPPPMGWEHIVTRCDWPSYSGNWCIANCSAGKHAIGGGCEHQSTWASQLDGPRDNGYACQAQQGSAGDYIVAHVFCANIQ